jgi:GNAT superfamily N-acetyltransferase
MPVPIDDATEADLGALLPLMRSYCDFYGVSPADEGLEEMARALIAAPTQEGMLLVARDEDGTPIGFAAVGWKWSSLRAARVAIMEDLFVDPDARRGGAGQALIEACAERARSHGAPAMLWETAVDNKRAQSVYERIGANGETWLEYELEL